jgi:hypothetical protein
MLYVVSMHEYPSDNKYSINTSINQSINQAGNKASNQRQQPRSRTKVEPALEVGVTA